MFISVQQAAERFGVSPATIRRHGPRPVKIGRRIVYDEAELDRHFNVLQDVDNLLKSLAIENSVALFTERNEFHKGANRTTRSFDMTRDGFTLLARGSAT